MLIADWIFRWLHVGAAIVLIGGSVFMRFVVMQAAAKLSEEEHDGFRERLLGVWRKFVMSGIGILLISGVYNLVRALGNHRGDSAYHAIFGVKFLLAFAVFFLASALVGRSPAFAHIRANARKWLGVTILLAATIVIISGFLKVRPFTASEAAEPSTQASE